MQIQTIVGLGLIVILTTIVCAQAAGTWCFACTNVFHPAICQSVVQCGEHEFCHTEKTVNNNGAERYTTSCKGLNECKTRVKRSVSTSLLCDQCCNGTLCNAVGCGAPPVKTPQQLYCLKCDFAQKPSDCDTVEVCSVDKVCSLATDKTFFQFYKMGCRSKSSCPTNPHKGNLCCDTNLCNSNDLGINPALYTTTPVPTTRKPAKPIVTFDNNTLVYKVTHQTGEKLELLCHVTGGPMPKVTWTFDNMNGSTVPVTNGVSIAPNGDSILSITMPDKLDSGIYTCNASNVLGHDEKQITVDVLNPPKIDGKLNNSVDVQFQGDVTLDCNVTMDNNTKVDWIIPPTVKSYTIHPNHSLTLYNVHNENNADYLCVAENGDGNTTKTFSLSVNATTNLQFTLAPSTCPIVTAPTCPTVTVPSCPTVTVPSCPTVTVPSCPTVTVPTCPTIPSTLSTALTNPPLTNPPLTNPPLSNPPVTNPPVTTTTSKATTKPVTASSNPTYNPNPASPSTNKVFDQFQSEKRQVNIMQCPKVGQSNTNVTWHRLVNDFDHTDPVYIANNIGVLTISGQMSVLNTGVYECRIGNVPIAQFAVYGDIPNSVACSSVFGTFTQTEGVVMRARCPDCANPLSIRPTLQIKTSDRICESAMAKNLIPKTGGYVVYLLDHAGKVVILNQTSGNILV